MVKQVPLTTGLTQTLNTGSPVQFTGSSVEPMDNKMPGQIRSQSTAMSQLQKASQALADQLNDAEATKLYNEFQPELETNHNAYLELKGLDAVRSIPSEEEGGEVTHTLDTYRNTNLENLKEKYLKKASNGSVRFLFESKAHQAISDSQEKMTRHSIKEQKAGHTKSLRDYLEITTRETIDDYENWNKDGSVYLTRKFVGMALIDEIAMINGWNIDATKGRVSSLYLAERSKYLLEVSKGVLEKMRDNDVPDWERDKYRREFYGELGEETATDEGEKIKNDAREHNKSACVNAILKDNGNTNDGSYISSANFIHCLSSSNSFDDNAGGAVVFGEHTEGEGVDTTEKSISEIMETREQLLHTESIFYKPDSKLNGTLIDQHKTTHLFASLHLGIEKADSLYTKAKSQIDIDPKQFKNNPVYAKNINGQIMTNYKKLIVEESEKKYRKDILDIKKEIKKLEDTPDLYTKPFSSLGPLPGTDDYEKSNKDAKKRRKIKQLKKNLELEEVEDSGYFNKIVNDLNTIESNINYDYDPQITAKLKIDKVSGLQPLSVLEARVRATITDPKEQEAALKDLRIKYKEITDANNEIYTQDFKKAKIISFATEGGYNDLAANGININDFKEEDQKILRNGQPEKSDIDTLIMLGDNPEQLKDDLNKYDYRLNKKDLLELEDFAAGLDTPDKILEVKVDNEMLDIEIKRAGFDDIIDKDSKKEEYKTNYQEVKAEWKRRVDLAQIANKGEKISREAKRKLLKEILEDRVFTGEKTGPFWNRQSVEQPNITLELDPKDDAYVNLNGEDILLSSIPSYMRDLIRERLRNRRPPVPYDEASIVKRWVEIGRPRATNKTEWDTHKSTWKPDEKNNKTNVNFEKELKGIRYLGYF
jgi:hypothetical protein